MTLLLDRGWQAIVVDGDKLVADLDLEYPDFPARINMTLPLLTI